MSLDSVHFFAASRHGGAGRARGAVHKQVQEFRILQGIWDRFLGGGSAEHGRAPPPLRRAQ